MQHKPCDMHAQVYNNETNMTYTRLQVPLLTASAISLAQKPFCVASASTSSSSFWMRSFIKPHFQVFASRQQFKTLKLVKKWLRRAKTTLCNERSEPLSLHNNRKSESVFQKNSHMNWASFKWISCTNESCSRTATSNANSIRRSITTMRLTTTQHSAQEGQLTTHEHATREELQLCTCSRRKLASTNACAKLIWKAWRRKTTTATKTATATEWSLLLTQSWHEPIRAQNSSKHAETCNSKLERGINTIRTLLKTQPMCHDIGASNLIVTKYYQSTVHM